MATNTCTRIEAHEHAHAHIERQQETNKIYAHTHNQHSKLTVIPYTQHTVCSVGLTLNTNTGRELTNPLTIISILRLALTALGTVCIDKTVLCDTHTYTVYTIHTHTIYF